MKINLVPFETVWHDIKSNLEQIKNIVELTKDVDLIVFPETSITGFSMEKGIHELIDYNYIIEFLGKLAKKNCVGIIVGLTYCLNTECYNEAVVFSYNGAIIKKYKKNHLFSHSKEDLIFVKGHDIPTFTFNGITFSVTICYDLRFPYLFYENPAEIYINIANWPSKRINHWEALIKSRAIENQSFFLGVNAKYTHDDNEYLGELICYDYNGLQVLNNPAVFGLVYEIDTNKMRKFRTNFNVLNDSKYRTSHDS
jgi:omega-amidase